MILFSIVIPTHNRSKLLKKCIKSVLSQQAENWELLIVDNASTDDTKIVVKSFQDSRIRYFFQEQADRSLARNKGIEEARGKYIIFIDDDDYILENHLSEFKKAIKEVENPDAIFRVGFLMKQGQSLRTTRNYLPEKDKHPVRFAAFNMCSTCSLCIPRHCLNQNRFPPGFPHWQDTHLILRLFAKYPLIQLPLHTYVYVQHPNMGTEHIFSKNMALERIKINIAAIEHLFINYSDEINPYLPLNTEKFLIAEKYLHYAIADITRGERKHFTYFIKQSLKTKIHLKFIRYYLVILKHLVS